MGRAVHADGEPGFPEWTLAAGPPVLLRGADGGMLVAGCGVPMAVVVSAGFLGVPVPDGVGDDVAGSSHDGCGSGTAAVRHTIVALGQGAF